MQPPLAAGQPGAPSRSPDQPAFPQEPVGLRQGAIPRPRGPQQLLGVHKPLTWNIHYYRTWRWHWIPKVFPTAATYNTSQRLTGTYVPLFPISPPPRDPPIASVLGPTSTRRRRNAFG